MRTVTWIDLVAAENVPCRALFLVVVTPRTLGAKHVNAKTRNSMVQHDASFQHRNLRKAVLHKSNPVGAGAVTDLEEPAHSVKTGATVRSIQNRDPSVIRGKG